MNSLRLIAVGALVTVALPLSAFAQQAAPAPDRVPNKNVSMCTGCHTIPGYQASFPRVYRVPMISGQSAKYIEAALQGYKKGERKHPTMNAVAAGLTDDDIKYLANYYAERGANTAVAASK